MCNGTKSSRERANVVDFDFATSCHFMPLQVACHFEWRMPLQVVRATSSGVLTVYLSPWRTVVVIVAVIVVVVVIIVVVAVVVVLACHSVSMPRHATSSSAKWREVVLHRFTQLLPAAQ